LLLSVKHKPQPLGCGCYDVMYQNGGNENPPLYLDVK
jgi:hypothetical protein